MYRGNHLCIIPTFSFEEKVGIGMDAHCRTSFQQCASFLQKKAFITKTTHKAPTLPSLHPQSSVFIFVNLRGLSGTCAPGTWSFCITFTPCIKRNMIYYVPDLDKSPQYYMLHFIETTVPVLLDHQTREEVLIHNG